MSTKDIPARRQVPAVVRYGMAVGSVTVALIATLPWATTLVSPLFFLAVILTAWLGGGGPGMLAAVFAGLAIDYFFLPPTYSFNLDSTNAVQLLVFLLSAAVVSSLSAVRDRTLVHLQRARDELEAKVQERTADLTAANDKLRAEIAERKRREEALREQAALLDLTHDTVFARDMRDVITYWNRGATELYGWDRHEIVGKTSHELTRTMFSAPLPDINRTLLATGRWEGQLVHTKRDGSQVVVASRWALQRDADGNPVAILETNNDVTEQRRAEEALRESEEQWRAVFENNPTMYFMVDAAGTILSVNPFGAEQLGYTVGELIGRPVLDVFHEADREGVQRNVAACLEQPGRAISWEFRKVRKDGSVLWVRETARAMLLKGRAVVLVVCEDVTERKRAEAALRSTEQRLTTVIANSPIVLFALDPSGVFTLSEGKGLDVLGSKSGELVGRSAFDLYRDRPRVVSAVRRALDGEAHTEVVEVNDSVFETHYRPFFDERGAVAGVNGVATDITERRRAERDLRESERKYRNIFEAAGVSIWEQDFSDVQAAIDGLKARGVRDFREYTAAHPEFVRHAILMVKVTDVNEATGRLFAAKSKDELLSSLDRVFLPETEEVFRGELIAIAEGRTYFESETVLQTLSGDRLTVLFTITFPPPPGRLDRVLVTITDISERKRAEEALQKAQAELAHVTRVTTMGELASSIAHEVNQPLAAVTTNGNAGVRWLGSEPPNLDEARGCLRRIVRDAARASEIIARIRKLVKKSPPAKESVDVAEAIQEVLAMANAEARRHHVTMRTQCSVDVPLACGDRIQLQQVLLNLVMNAIEAMKPVTGRPRELLIRCEQNEPGTILVAVRDSGIGVDPQGTDRIFDAFYTTKPDGLGMGLSLSRSIIEAHGGRLWTIANDDHGATFQFTLPTDRGAVYD